MHRLPRLALALAALAAAQDVVFRVDVNLVNVPVHVTNPDGTVARNLKPEDFEILDNGEPRRVENLWFESGLPLTIGIVMDVSDSQEDRAGEQRAALADFFRGVLRPGDRAFLVSVGAEVRLTRDLTADPEELVRAIQLGAPVGPPLGGQCALRVFAGLGKEPGAAISDCGGTALWNGVWAALRLRLLETAGRKALIVMSDGVDTGSSRSFAETLVEAHRSEALVYAIKYPRHATARPVFRPQRLAEETGGLQFLAADGGYGAMFQRIADDLRNRYVIGFHPGETPGFHALNISVKRDGARVRSRAGYLRR